MWRGCRVTYLNTASFAFYLLPWAIRKYVLHRVEPEAGRLQCVIIHRLCQIGM